MQLLTLVTVVVLLVLHSADISQAAYVRSYHKRSDLEAVKPISDLGWKVPLTSGSHALPLPSTNKKLQYLTLGRGVMTYECNSTIPGDDQPAYLYQSTDLYDVAPLAQNLPNEDSLHSLVPHFCDYDYAELRNTSMSCVGRIYNEFGHTVVDLFGFSVPKFTSEIAWAIPSPAGPTVSGYWAQSTTIDKDWEVYRVETAGGVTPSTCKGHGNSTIDVVYAAEYWFYHE